MNSLHCEIDLRENLDASHIDSTELYDFWCELYLQKKSLMNGGDLTSESHAETTTAKSTCDEIVVCYRGPPYWTGRH